MSLHCPFCDVSLDDPAVGAGSCSACERPLVVEGYRLTRELGRGAMATVYEGERSGGQRVAIKVLRLAGEHSDRDRDGWSAWEMFERSSKILRELSHPGLPKVFHFSRDDASGHLVLVREAFDGGTLAERIEAGRRLTRKQMHRLAKKLLELLDYLHGLVPPVIHRDIKPANIMFRSTGSWAPVLVDFDTVAAPEGQRTGLTIVATIGYAAPEQFAGEATVRSDLYGLGTTLLHVATETPPDQLPREHGRFQFEGRLDELSPELRRVIAKLIEPDPEHRYPNAAAALAELSGVRQQTPIGAKVAAAADHTPLTADAPIPSDAAPTPTKPSLDKAKGVDKGKGVAIAVGLLATVLVVFALNALDCGKPACMKRENQECMAGAAKPCWALGTHYERGKGVKLDLVRAQALYRQSCDRGYAKGCNALGRMLHGGKGGRVDQPGATTAYVTACQGGYHRACQLACRAYKLGEGVKVDYDRALALCRRGCDRGDSYSCNDLAVLYKDGLGAPVDLPRAERLFDRACRASDYLACHNLAKMVRKDRARFLALEKKACQGKIKAACNAR